MPKDGFPHKTRCHPGRQPKPAWKDGTCFVDHTSDSWFSVPNCFLTIQWEENLCFRKKMTWRLKCMHIQGQLSSIMFLLIKHFDWKRNRILKMFASKYVSVILTCVFRMHKGMMSSGLLTSGNLFVLSVHVCWHWKVSLVIVFLHRQTLDTFKSLWDSVIRPVAMKRFPEKMSLWKPLKLNNGHGIAQNWHLLGLVDRLWL